MFFVSSTLSPLQLPMLKINEAKWTENINLNDCKEVYLNYLKISGMLSDFKDQTNFRSSEACRRVFEVN